MAADHLSTDDAARRLGVKRETIYAYVSRGLLTRQPQSTRRRSLFDRADVERLAGRARHTDRSGALEVVVATELTLLEPDGRLSFRGRDAVELARFASFEQVAALLWEDTPRTPWELDPDRLALVRRVSAALPDRAGDRDRIPVIVAALGAAETHRADRRADHVRAAGRDILAAIVDGLPRRAPIADRSIAARLWAVLGDRAATPAQLGTLNAALVLLADHELASSTLAARVTASAWGDLHRVVLAGLGPLGGALHGEASLATETMLRAGAGPDDVARALDAQLGVDGVVPGFGHRVYRGADPRAVHLLGLVDRVASDRAAVARVRALLDAAAAHGLPPANVDVGLAAVTSVMGLRPGAAATIFHVARVAGLVAHALEEYPHRLRFRPRASYVGPMPSTSSASERDGGPT